MDKVYEHKDIEEKLYKKWEEKGYFQPEINPHGDPFTIILPPPNANGDLHFGHAMFVIEDILIRSRRMMGMASLWLPGTDHAGTETQFVFEKRLQEQGKSRFDYNREDLFNLIFDYVKENRGGIEHQLRKLGFSLDWSRQKFTMDEDIVAVVHKTFRKMYDEGLVYRAHRLVNYCTFDGTSFSDLEVVYQEKQSPLYYIKYGPLVLATTRPETKFGDTGVAVHPQDKRYQQYIGKEIEIETVLGKAKIKVVGDEAVDPEFGTGVVKITPAHDFTDFEIGQRHHLPLKQVIGYDGKLNEHAGEFEGLYIKQARKAVVEQMQKKGLIEKIDETYQNRVGVCYKCKNVIEPLPLDQWFVKMKPLAQKAHEAVTSGGIRLYPKNFESLLFQFLDNIRDWNISRQNVWGIQIPIWYEIEKEEDFIVTFVDEKGGSQSGDLSGFIKNGVTFETITKGLQRVMAKTGVKTVFTEQKEKGKRYLPETDTFDTWFSSAQWPFATLQTTKEGDFTKFYPTSVMETGYDILRWWVARMMMVGIYTTENVPFKDIVLHGLVNDPYGKKMSKSKGNVVNPLEVVEQYGADAVRFALVYGTALGNDQALSYPKLEAMRKFTNKLWNMGRFIEFQRENGEGIAIEELSFAQMVEKAVHQNDKTMVKKVEALAQKVTKQLEVYDFNHAAQDLYDFTWHEFADVYIEDVKQRIDGNSHFIVSMLYVSLLKMLHPFMPFVTEEIYQKIPGHGESLMISTWPISAELATS